jgi:hypothetical protein
MAAELKTKQSISKGRQLGVRFATEKRNAWDELATSRGKQPSTLARAVLEEYMSCFLPAQRLEQLGMGEFRTSRRLLEEALGRGRENSAPAGGVARTEDSTPERMSPSTGSLRASLLTCGRCGFDIAPKDKFCGGCGTPVARKKHCTNCGSELGLGQMFCTQCRATQG